MGLFASRPEEPFEWAGLPAEPRDADEGADRLTERFEIDPAGLVGSGMGSIVVPVEPEPAVTPDDADEDDAAGTAS